MLLLVLFGCRMTCFFLVAISFDWDDSGCLGFDVWDLWRIEIVKFGVSEKG